MKRKIGTVLDEDLLMRAKQAALINNKSLCNLLEDALKIYLLQIEKKKNNKQKSVVQSTFGAMKVSKKIFKSIMEDEGVYDVE